MMPAFALAALALGALAAPAGAQPSSRAISVDPTTGLVLAREMKTGRAFSFSAGDELARVQVGTGLEADFNSRRILFIDGRAVTSQIELKDPEFGPAVFHVSLVAQDASAIQGALAALAPRLSANPLLNPKITPPKEYASSGVVVVRDVRSGSPFAAWVDNGSLMPDLAVGQSAHVDATGGWIFVQPASAGANPTTYCFRLSGAGPFPPPVAVAQTPTAAPGAEPAEPGGKPKTFSITANPDILNSRGRILVAFPKDAMTRNTVVEIHQVIEGLDKVVRSDVGGFSEALLPGTYNVVISDKVVRDVEVRAKHDTKVFAGVLRLRVEGTRRVLLLDADTGKAFKTILGSSDVGLPIGLVGVQTTGSTLDVVRIRDGQIATH